MRRTGNPPPDRAATAAYLARLGLGRRGEEAEASWKGLLFFVLILGFMTMGFYELYGAGLRQILRGGKQEYNGVSSGGGGTGGSKTCATPGCSDTSGTPHPHPVECFVAGTQISMFDGSFKNIEDVVVGEEILSCLVHENKLVTKKVVGLFSQVHTADEVKKGNHTVKITLSDGTVVHTTMGNAFWSKDKGFVAADAKFSNKHQAWVKASNFGKDTEQMEIGDTLFVHTSKSGLTESIKPVARPLEGGIYAKDIYQLNEVEVQGIEYILEPDIKTYDLSVEDTHVFFANGVITHNTKPSKDTPDFNVPEGGSTTVTLDRAKTLDTAKEAWTPTNKEVVFVDKNEVKNVKFVYEPTNLSFTKEQTGVPAIFSAAKTFKFKSKIKDPDGNWRTVDLPGYKMTCALQAKGPYNLLKEGSYKLKVTGGKIGGKADSIDVTFKIGTPGGGSSKGSSSKGSSSKGSSSKGSSSKGSSSKGSSSKGSSSKGSSSKGSSGGGGGEDGGPALK